MSKRSTYKGTSQRAGMVETGMKGCMEWICETPGERKRVAGAVVLR